MTDQKSEFPHEQPHPSTMTDEAKAALAASDPSAFDEDAPESAVEGQPTPPAAEASAAGAEGDAGAPAADSGDDERIDVKAFKGVLAELRETRAELKSYKEAQAGAAAATPERNFEDEAAALVQKYEDGMAALLEKYENADIDMAELVREQGKLNIELQTANRELARAEGEAVAASALSKREAAAAQQSAEEAWNAAIGEWKQSNAEFLANPLRRNAVAALLDEYSKDPNLSDAELIEKVQREAFEAFNWAAGTPAAGAGAADPHAARRRAEAAAAAAAAGMPGLPAGGVGGRGVSDSPVDLTTLKPGKFSTLSKADQERMLGEGALD